MGGFRCTYRNCSVRSDGQTHMFHYPVFDKPRCHQWLVNAQKLEFLDLKVSQLKNRVLCQHHFKDECFMNYKKDKLKFDAVPTENGPFCDASSDQTEELSKYCISLEDIDKECLSSKDKKANFSVKYGDFLTNGEIAHFVNLAIESDFNNKEKDASNLLLPYFEVDKKLNSPSKKTHKPLKVQPPLSEETGKLEITIFNDDIKIGPLNTNKKISEDRKKISIIAEKKISTPITIKGELKPLSPSAIMEVPKKIQTTQLTDGDGSYVIIENPHKSQGGKNRNFVIFDDPQRSDETKRNFVILDKPNAVDQDANGNIVIIENLSTVNNNSLNVNIDPCPFTSEVNMSTSIDSRIEKMQPKSENNIIETQPPQASENLETGMKKALSETSVTMLTMDEITKLLNDTQETQSQKPLTTLLKPEQCDNEKNNHTKMSSNASTRNRMPPERIAAIEQKRKINKQKLWDMIGFFLDEIDGQDKKHSEKKSPTKEQKRTGIDLSNVNTYEKSQTDISENVKNIVSAKTRLPSLEEHTIASLESKIQKLEETLSQKIDQNSQRILELKSIMPQQNPKSMSVGIQTKNISESEESCKKRLFNEISRYLSPNTNSLIYEELFINNLVINVGKAVPNRSDSLEYNTRAKRQKRGKV